MTAVCLIRKLRDYIQLKTQNTNAKQQHKTTKNKQISKQKTPGKQINDRGKHKTTTPITDAHTQTWGPLCLGQPLLSMLRLAL